MAVHRHESPRARKALDTAALDRLALRYVERYATTRAKLAAYLARKVREHGWEDEGAPPIDGLVERFEALGYVDDRSFAASRAAALTRRGYGERRVSIALKAAGISDEDGAPARADARLGAPDAALAYARRKRIGPFAAEMPDREQRRRLLAAMLRAGHPFEISRRIIESEPEPQFDPGAP